MYTALYVGEYRPVYTYTGIQVYRYIHIQVYRYTCDMIIWRFKGGAHNLLYM